MKPMLALVAALSLAFLSACGSSTDRARLVHEDQVPDLAELKALTAAVPNHTTLVPTGPDPRVCIAVHELSSPGHDRVVVMVHGVLSDHGAWRFIAGDLARSYDVMLLDLPGCGESDKPSPESLGPEGYSPGALAERLLQALQTRLTSRGDAETVRVTLVAHSLGGAVTLRMLCDQELTSRYAGVLARVDGLVLLSPLDVNVNKPDPTFRRIVDVSETWVDVGRATGLLRERVIEATRNSVVSPDRALEAEAETRLAYFRHAARREAAQAMLRQAVPWKDGRPDWDAIERIESEYRRIELPTLILWGRRDETLPVAMGYKLQAQLPAARLVCLPEVMHSPHVETPGMTISLIREFVESGGQAQAGR